MADPRSAETTDEHWVARARAGDLEAFEELVRRHQRPLYSFCRRLTGDHDRADESAQEAFARAWFSLARFRGESLFSTWLRQITLNLMRSRARRRCLESVVDAHPESLPACGAPRRRDEPEGAADPIRRRRLEAAVRGLPEKQRLTVVLKIYEERTHAEVAKLSGCTVGTVKANLFHALRRLRRALREPSERGGSS